MTTAAHENIKVRVHLSEGIWDDYINISSWELLKDGTLVLNFLPQDITLDLKHRNGVQGERNTVLIFAPHGYDRISAVADKWPSYDGVPINGENRTEF